MLEIEVVAICRKTSKCKGISKMTMDQFKVLKKNHAFIYRPFQLGFHSFKIED